MLVLVAGSTKKDPRPKAADERQERAEPATASKTGLLSLVAKAASETNTRDTSDEKRHEKTENHIYCELRETRAKREAASKPTNIDTPIYI